MSAGAGAAVVWPPELHLQPALFLPDVARARALGAAFAAGAAPWLATPARCACANAGALAAAGIARVELAGTSADAAAGAVLAHELRRLGIAVGGADGVAATAAPDAALPAIGDEVPFAVAPATRGVLPPWVFDAAGDGVLQRAAAVPTQGLPDGVRALRLHRGLPKGGDDGDDHGDAGTLHVLVLDEMLPLAAVADAAASLAARFGRARLRLAADAPASRFGARALAVLAVPALRERVLAAALAALPRLAPLLTTACHWCDLGVDPLLQCWAGNGIAERNADLTVNLVP